MPFTAAQVWATAGQPEHLARWWPRVERIEGIYGGGFTEVFRTEKGRTVRADWRVTRRDVERELRAEQELEGTPFAKILVSSVRVLRLTEAGEGEVRVQLALEQKLRGMARFGSPMVKQALRKQLDDALDGLEKVVT